MMLRQMIDSSHFNLLVRRRLAPVELYLGDTSYEIVPIAGPRYLAIWIEDYPLFERSEPWFSFYTNELLRWEARFCEMPVEHGLRSLAFGQDLYTLAISRFRLVIRLPIGSVSERDLPARPLQVWAKYETPRPTARVGGEPSDQLCRKCRRKL